MFNNFAVFYHIPSTAEYRPILTLNAIYVHYKNTGHFMGRMDVTKRDLCIELAYTVLHCVSLWFALKTA